MSGANDDWWRLIGISGTEEVLRCCPGVGQRKCWAEEVLGWDRGSAGQRKVGQRKC